MSSRIRNHIRGNVVGYVALFLVLTGGTAQALDGSNTVFSDDIVDAQVMTADVRNGAITTSKIAADAVRTGRVADNNLTSADIAAQSLTGDDIANGSINGNQINESFVGIGGDLSGSLANAQLGTGVVGSNEVAANSLGGSDIDESALGPVPLASNADTVDGVGSRVISFHDDDPPGLGDHVLIGGLDLRINCIGVSPGSDNVEIQARTNTDNSWLQAVAKADGTQNPTTTVADLDFDSTEVKEVQTPGDGSGQLIYRRGLNGGVVTATYGYNEGTSSCDAIVIETGSD